MKNCMLVLLIAVISIIPSLSTAAGIKVGVINSMTGPEAPIGENLTNGIKLAQEDLKKKGIAVDLVWEDDTGKPQIAMSAMEKLATRDRVGMRQCSRQAGGKIQDSPTCPRCGQRRNNQTRLQVGLPDKCSRGCLRVGPHRCSNDSRQAEIHCFYI
jgi:hypothetical protein